MKSLLIIFFPALIFSQTQFTVSLSPYWSENWQARNDAAKAEILAYLEKDEVKSASVSWWDSYSYAASDSAFPIVDMASDSTLILFRYVDPPTCGECQSECIFTVFEKRSPVKKSVIKFTGMPKKVKPLSKADKDFARSLYREYEKKVSNAVEEGKNKTWKDASGKVIAKKDYRKYAWREITAKEKITKN